MSDILIPMARDPGHEGMDDTAEWATSPRTFVPQGCDQQGRYTPTIAAEACSELGADDYSEADEKQSRLVTVVLVVAIWVLALPAAWFGVAHLFKTMVEAAP
jgi:hypothetical protein